MDPPSLSPLVPAFSMRLFSLVVVGLCIGSAGVQVHEKQSEAGTGAQRGCWGDQDNC